MRIGVCCGPCEWQLVKKLGYDYVEGNFSEFATGDEAHFEYARNLLEQLDIRAETFNGFFANVRLYEVSEPWLEAYAERGFARAAALGGDVAVIGSGYARRVPDGMTYKEACERFARVLTICGDAAQRHGMRVVIEPLRRSECNFINTLRESLALCEQVNHPAVGTLLDFFHFYDNGESVADIADSGKYLWHTHIARPNPDRNAPGAEDTEAMRAWVEALKGIGYHARMSLECIWKPDFTKAVNDACPVMDIFRVV